MAILSEWDSLLACRNWLLRYCFFDSGRLCGFGEVGRGIRCCHRTGDATWIVVARCHVGVVAAASQIKIDGERREGVIGRTYGIYTPNEHEPQVGR
jgi:hypothetical protein